VLWPITCWLSCCFLVMISSANRLVAVARSPGPTRYGARSSVSTSIGEKWTRHRAIPFDRHHNNESPVVADSSNGAQALATISGYSNEWCSATIRIPVVISGIRDFSICERDWTAVFRFLGLLEPVAGDVEPTITLGNEHQKGDHTFAENSHSMWSRHVPPASRFSAIFRTWSASRYGAYSFMTGAHRLIVSAKPSCRASSQISPIPPAAVAVARSNISSSMLALPIESRFCHRSRLRRPILPPSCGRATVRAEEIGRSEPPVADTSHRSK